MSKAAEEGRRSCHEIHESAGDEHSTAISRRAVAWSLPQPATVPFVCSHFVSSITSSFTLAVAFSFFDTKSNYSGEVQPRGRIFLFRHQIELQPRGRIFLFRHQIELPNSSIRFFEVYAFGKFAIILEAPSQDTCTTQP